MVDTGGDRRVYVRAIELHRMIVFARVRVQEEQEVKSEYVSESRAMEGKFGGCGAAAPRNFF
jgi:hypothetical protein